jgi:uncharacterized membrane protein YuzA (DUF378 family)
VKTLNSIALVLLIIGGLNWGLVGLFNVDLVAALFGGTVGPRSALSNIVYIVVGLAAIYGIYLLRPLGVGSDVVDRDDTRTDRRVDR